MVVNRDVNSSHVGQLITRLTDADQTRGPSPLQAIFENTKGPLPNPGHLLAMKTPFCRGVRSPLNIPLFPLNGQRRWSEAAAGEVIDDNTTDAENQMRRWSMPWEATKSDQNTVTWYQTRIMPINNINSISHNTTCSDRSVSDTPEAERAHIVIEKTPFAEYAEYDFLNLVKLIVHTPRGIAFIADPPTFTSIHLYKRTDLNWQSSAASHDGLTEAIQLLSCRPSRVQGPILHGYSTQQSDVLNTD